MIFYSHTESTEAEFCTDTISPRTGKLYDYTYYMDLSKRYRDRTMQDNEYFDLQVLHRMFKWYK